MNGVGGQVGPDLIELQPRLTDKKLSPLDVLTELIEPSKVINEKYRTTVFELKNGKVVSGLVVAQTEKEIHLRSNPLDQKDDRPIVIKRDEIDEKTESKVSLMPIGLLNSLTEDEVLDLMAYVLSGGK
jgi:putative heme-binding domain-containing protein